MSFGLLSLSLATVAGICLGAAMHFSFLAWRLRQRLDGLYALGFLSAALSFLVSMAYRQALSPEGFKFWFQVHSMVSRPLFFAWAWFILRESRYLSPWPARIWLGAEALKALLLVLSLDSPYFMRIEGVARHPSIWGETLSAPLGPTTWLYPIQLIMPLMSMAFGLNAALRLWRRGSRARSFSIAAAIPATGAAVFTDNWLDAKGLPELALGELVAVLPLGLMAWEATERLVTKTREQELESQLLHAQKMRAVGELASGIAHDFNNLLASIRMASEFLIERAVGAAEEKDILRRATAQASELTHKLLAVGRKSPERPQPLSVHAQLDAALTVAAPSLGPGITLAKDYAAARDGLQGDAGLLQGAFINLALNARDAMAGKGRLRISTRLDGPVLEIRFTDEGRGIPPEALPRIFDPYFTTKAEGKGSGLGLAMVAAAARAHGGSIKAFSEEGEGASFVMRLPLGAEN